MKICSLIIILSSTLLFYNCSKENSEANRVSNYKNYYFTANIDEEIIIIKHGENDIYNSMSGAGWPISSSEYYYSENSILTNDNDTSTIGIKYFKIEFVKEYSNSTGPTNCAEYMSVFQIGNYPFGETHNGKTEGIVINYLDSNYKTWRSDYSPGSQSGSNFDLIEYKNSTNSNKKIIKANFNCTLYDDNGNSINLKNGTFRSEVGWCL